MAYSTNLVTFLRARLDEDDEARNRLFEFDRDTGFSDLDVGNDDLLVISGGRVLREVEAKRRIVERHQPRLVEGRDGDGVEREAWFCAYDDEPWPCADARDAVAPYSDHPDYQTDWAV